MDSWCWEVLNTIWWGPHASSFHISLLVVFVYSEQAMMCDGTNVDKDLWGTGNLILRLEIVVKRGHLLALHMLCGHVRCRTTCTFDCTFVELIFHYLNY